MGTPAQSLPQPSTARVVLVDGFGPFPRGTWQVAPLPLSWPLKDPGDLLDYVVDFSRALAGDPGDCISTLDVAIAPANAGDLAVQQLRVDGDLAVVWLSAGMAGTTYAVTILVGTKNGRSLSRTVGLSVQTLSTPAPFGSVITDESGAPLTDQSDVPLTVV